MINNGRQQKTDKNTKGNRYYSSDQVRLLICMLVIINLVLVIVWLFTSCNEEGFFAHFSFASTVTSIILSVLAIFISVTGEFKTQTIRDRIDQEADEMITVTSRLESRMDDLSGQINVIAHNTDNIYASVNAHPEIPQVANGSPSV